MLCSIVNTDKLYQDPNLKDYKKKVLDMVKYATDKLSQMKGFTYQNIIELFMRYGFKKNQFYVDAVMFIKEKITTELKGNLTWLKKQSFTKSIKKEKSIIMFYLLIFYRNKFIDYLDDFLSENCSIKCDELLADLQKVIDMNKDVYPQIQHSNNLGMIENRMILEEQDNKQEKTEKEQENEINLDEELRKQQEEFLNQEFHIIGDHFDVNNDTFSSNYYNIFD